MQTVQSSFTPRTQFVTHFVLPSLAIILVILTDTYLITETAVTPLGCTILLTILAMYMRPWPLAIWAVICVAIVFCTLKYGFNADMSKIGMRATNWTATVRTFGSIVVGAALVILSIHRQKLHQSHDEILEMLTKFPVPVIVSDASGSIVFLNERAGHLLEISPEEGVGLSYFELLLHQNGKGANIKKYVELIDSPHSEATEINIRTRNRPTKLLKGMLVSADTR
ncbi:MAG: PAS domain-containing protein, partial [Verrucomicrobiota bacterium]